MSESSDSGYAKQVKKGKQRKSSKKNQLTENLINNNETRGDEQTLNILKKACTQKKSKFATLIKKFKADVVQYEKLVKEIESNIREQQSSNTKQIFNDPSKERLLTKLKDDIQGSMKEVNQNFKDLTNMIVEIKNFVVDSWGDQENRLKKTEDAKLERDLTNLRSIYTSHTKKFGESLQKLQDCKSGKVAKQSTNGDYSDEEANNNFQPQRQAQKQVQPRTQSQLRQEATTDQLLDMKNQQLQDFQTYLELMGEMEGIQQDINTQLDIDQVKVDQVVEDMDEALVNMEGADEQLIKKRDSTLKSIKKNLWCVLILLIITIIVCSITFGGGSTVVKVVEKEVPTKPESAADDSGATVDEDLILLYDLN